MFDQNWLKRYMLQNQPRAADENSVVPQAAKVQQDQRPRGLNLGADSALRERTGPNRLDAIAQEEALPLKTPALASVSSRISEASARDRPKNRVPQSNGYPVEPPALNMPQGQHRSTSSTAPPSAHNQAPPSMQPQAASAQVRGFSTPGRPPDAVSSYGGRSPDGMPQPCRTPPRSPGNQMPQNQGTPGKHPRPWHELPGGGSRGCPTPLEAPQAMQPSWPMPMTGFGVQSGPFGHSAFDNSANMYNLWNYGNEGNLKHFVVMCKDDVEIRASPTYADDTRIGHFLHPGQVVVIDERRMVNGSWFLHLADGRGWVFETKERLLVMTETREFERGLWHYNVVCDDDVETRIAPTYSDDARTGVILGSQDCVAIDERCSVAGARFLKLADGRGWVFETKDRLLVMSEVRAKAQEARDFARGLWHYTVVCDDDIEIRAAPTYSDEARTGLMIHPGDCVAIDERCRIAAAWFLRLADGRGWIFETKDSRRVMMQLR